MNNKILIECPACGRMVEPKPVSKCARRGTIMSFYVIEYDCPKCGMERIYNGKKE